MNLASQADSVAVVPTRTVKLSELVNRGRVARVASADSLESGLKELLLARNETSMNCRTREGAIRQLAVDLLRHVGMHRNDSGLLTREALRSIENCLRAMDQR